MILLVMWVFGTTRQLTAPAEMRLDAQLLMLVSMWGVFLFTLWCFLRVARSGNHLKSYASQRFHLLPHDE
jgi:uncharacterized membrane protein